MSSKLAVVLIAMGVVLLGWGVVFEVQVQPRQWLARLRPSTWLGTAAKQEQANQVNYQALAEQVIPATGKTVVVEWGSMGQKLVQAGAVDMIKFKKIFPELTEEQKEVLEGDDLHQITFTAENIGFWTDVLWALGLTQKSKVLNEGPMMENRQRTPVENYASTAGWTLGKKTAMQLYNSSELIKLTPDQDELVYRVAENIFRPCCGNSAAYPDCNHGMAVLGLLELLAAQGAGEEEMYQAALAFNSYAFANTYITAAADFVNKGISWAEVRPKEVLGQAFSSGQGASVVAKEVGEIPGAPKRGASCGV